MLAGISRDSRHKRRGTGGRRNVHVKKRKSELGRPAAETKIGEKRCVVRDNEVSFHWWCPLSVHTVRGRGGNLKYRALRLDVGNFCWGSEGILIFYSILEIFICACF